MEYTFITSQEIDQLMLDVRHFVRGGWKPDGGVCVEPGPSGTVFIQAMAKLIDRTLPVMAQ